MAGSKCLVCNTKRAKRRCFLHDSVCPKCCTLVREKGECPDECQHQINYLKYRYSKELHKFEEEFGDEIDFSEHNQDVRVAIYDIIGRNFFKIFEKDSYYNDEIVLHAVKFVHRMMRNGTSFDTETMVLNRANILICDLIDSLKFIQHLKSFSQAQLINALATIEFVLLETHLSQGKRHNFVHFILETFEIDEEDAEVDDHGRDRKLII